jgi:hypothetical protein
LGGDDNDGIRGKNSHSFLIIQLDNARFHTGRAYILEALSVVGI